jgi:serine phosphatase RsbU (regulator of sigma subunit)
MMTPPPPSARKSSGQMPAFGASGGQTPPPPPARAPGGAGAAGQPVRRPVIAAKPQGLPIKMKVVLSMSALSIGIVIIMFLIVQLVGRSALEDTIRDSGRANLQQAEANYRNYVNTLSETGMIAYFQSRKDKFGKYWDGLHRPWPTAEERKTRRGYPWFNKDIPGCRQFANYNQLINDRIWVMVASEIRGNYGEVANIPDEKKAAIIGKAHYDELKRNPTGKLLEPASPRQVNDEAWKDLSINFFGDLAAYYGLKDKQKSWSDLRTAIAKETQDNLVAHPQQGIRRAIFTEYKAEFVNDLDQLTTADDTQVRLLIFEIKTPILPGFDPAKDLSVISPSKEGMPEVAESSAKRTDKEMNIDPAAQVAGGPAFSFSRTQGSATGDVVYLYLDRKFINARQNNLVLLLFGVAFVAVLISLGTAFLVGGNITRPLQVLMSDIQIISGGNFDHKPIAQSRDEVGIVSRLLGDMAAGLKQAQEVWAENQSRKHDLDIAKEIQENLLPKHVPRIAGYDVSAYYSPSKEVGGDYYDFFLVDKTHLGMICADVSGKGIPGSMVMMMTKALVSYEAESNLSPRDIFCKVNRTLAKDIKRGMFVTAFYMLLDIPTARLTVASAGHNPLLMYRASTKQCVEINPGGIALGFDKDGRLFERNMKEETIQLQRGDRVVIYTDGVTEAMSPEGAEFTSERLISITTQAANAPSSQYLTTLVNALQAHAQSDDQHDDITIVTVKVG